LSQLAGKEIEISAGEQHQEDNFELTRVVRGDAASVR